MHPAPRSLLAVGLAVTFLLTGCNGDDAAGNGAAAPDEALVTIAGFAFDPPTIRASAGSPVRFDNTDGTTHTVTAGTPDAPDVAAFNEVVDAGQSVTIQVDSPGTHPYHCAIHPTMTGELVIE